MARRGWPWAALCGLLVSSPSEAQERRPPDGSAALQTLEPTPSGDRFFAVPDAEVHGFLDLNFGLYGGYAHRPLQGTAASTDYVTGQVYWSGDATLAVTELAMLNLSLPAAVNLSDVDNVEHGLGDLRIALRVHGFNDRRKHFNLGVQGDVRLPTGNADAFTGDGYARGQVRLLVSGATRRLAYASSLGYAMRKDEDLGTQIVGDSVSYGVALGVLLGDDRLLVGPELFGNVPISQQDAASPLHAISLEALLGAKLRLGDFVLGAGGGAGLTKAVGVPEARAMFSFAYVLPRRALDDDGDGLDDLDDRCPHDPGLTDDGCPAPDRDLDSILDADDACPDQPGLVHAEPDKHGCPPAKDYEMKPW